MALVLHLESLAVAALPPQDLVEVVVGMAAGLVVHA
jgi:hypothetical protein